MMTGKVKKRFNDSKNNGKYYEENSVFEAEEGRYIELYNKGFLHEGTQKENEPKDEPKKVQNEKNELNSMLE